MSGRVSWDKTWMDVARVVARRGTCPRAQVGAVLVSSTQKLVATGYNGAPRGIPHCDDVGCKIIDGHCARVLHAEVNVLSGTSWGFDGTLYVTQRPCLSCVKLCLQNRIRRVVFDLEYPMDDTMAFIHELLSDADLKLEKFADVT